MLWHVSDKLGYTHDQVTRADALSRADRIGLIGRTPWSVTVGAPINRVGHIGSQMDLLHSGDSRGDSDAL